MSATAESEIVTPLTAGSAAFPPSKPSSPFAKQNLFAGDAAAELEKAEQEPEEEVVEETPVEEPVSEEAEAPAEEKSEVSPDVAEAMERFGISQKAAEALGDEVIDLLASVDRQATTLYREKAPAQQPQQPAAPPSTETAKAETPTVKPLGKLKIELDPDEYTEDQIKTFTTLTDEINSQREVIQALAQLAVTTHDGVNKITGHTQAEAEAQYERLADSFFSNLGDGFSDLFGTEPIRQLPMQSPKIKFRNEVVEEALTLKAVDEQKGRTAKSDDQYLQRALRALHSDKLKTIARKEVLDEVSQRRKQAIRRPSSSNGVPLTSRQKAEKFIADSMRKMGIAVEE